MKAMHSFRVVHRQHPMDQWKVTRVHNGYGSAWEQQALTVHNSTFDVTEMGLNVRKYFD